MERGLGKKEGEGRINHRWVEEEEGRKEDATDEKRSGGRVSARAGFFHVKDGSIFLLHGDRAFQVVRGGRSEERSERRGEERREEERRRVASVRGSWTSRGSGVVGIVPMKVKLTLWK